MKKLIFLCMSTMLVGALLLTVACNNSGSNDPEDSVAPGEVTDLSKTVGDQQVTLQWTDPDDSDLDHIAITWGTNGSAEVDPNTETYTATSLTNGEEYTFTVKTVDTSGNASTGETITATPVAPDSTAPAEVTNLTKTIGDQQVTLDWTDPDDSDLDHIAITWGTSGSANVDPQTETYTATSLTNGEEYIFTVKTVDTSGNASTGETITATPAADGTISVSIINAPDTYYLWVFAYEEDEWNTDMPESVLATQKKEITGNTAEITLHEGCTADFSAPTGGTWTATGGETYDLMIYTTEDELGNITDRQASTLPTQVTVNGNKTVEVNYDDMDSYVQEPGTLTVSISGADEFNGESFIMAVFDEGDDPETDTSRANGDAMITDGSATITAQACGADWTGAGEAAYDVYFLIDLSDSGTPESGDYTVKPFPVTYYQDGDKVMDTVFPDDYEEY